MLTRSERTLENIPVGSLGIISLRGCEELGQKVDDYLVKWRHESAHQFKGDAAFPAMRKILSLSEPVFRVLDPVKLRASSKNLYVVRICT